MPVAFESLPILAAALALALATAVVALLRRPALPRLSRVLIGLGLLLLALAAAGMTWRRAHRGEVLVMVDVSPSTRTATYRNRATLDRRITQLLGAAPNRTLLFAETNQPDAGADPLPEVAAERTVFAPPPAADAILLFSDARFELPPAAPRTYPVIDPALDSVTDAAVHKLELRGPDAVADVAVSGPAPRQLSLSGTATTRPISVDRGSHRIAQPVSRGASIVSAQFAPADPWPENDGLWIHVPPPDTAQRWWIGPAAPPGWRAFDPAALPTDPADYLAPAVIVLSDVPAAAALRSAARLQQYVRDLGGSLVIVGGDHAFAAGDYGSSPLEALSPLASYPPRPAMQWIILVDGSGSMTEETAAAASSSSSSSRWHVASSAVAALLPHLPPQDLVALGSFAEKIAWWSAGRSARETASLPLPPPDVSPRGPTNLQRALRDVTRSAEPGTPKQLIIITDADAQLDGPDSIAAEMKSRQISLHVLAIGEGSALPALRQIAQATGGSVRSAGDATSWAAALLDLTRSAMPTAVERSPLPVRFLTPLSLPPRQVAPWNRTWMKSDATALADARTADESLHPVARWRLGTGEVIAAGFTASPTEALALADLIARPPRDPRYRITWDAGPTLKILVDAIDDQHYLNDQRLSLSLRDAANGTEITALPIPQSAPGRYELSLPAPRTPAFAAVRLDGNRLLDQVAIAGRYAPEFDAIGNDYTAMRQLALRTGGDVIDAHRTSPIDFHWPRRDLPLAPWLSMAGAILIAGGLVWWRLRA